MKIAIVKETRSNERRVAASPDTVKKYAAAGFDVSVQKTAGEGASFLDEDFAAVGAKIEDSLDAVLADADIILTVQGLEVEDLAKAKKGAALLGHLNAFKEQDRIKAYADAGLHAFAMEFMPRISRAQSMDILSSQSNLAGYKAVLDATTEFGRAFPMMMTAAGTVAPARVFVMGAGVAGLQAIATAKRLGAIVSATDVRAATKEQVESLGGSFVMVESDEGDGETAAGYAKEMSDDYKARQAQLVADTIAKQDIVITTALIPGRPAPQLVNDAMLQSMKTGSVLVDMAAESGGNVEGSEAGKVVKKHGVTIIGHDNAASTLAADTSSLFAKNLLNFLNLFIKDGGVIDFDWEDEVVTGTLMTKDGAIIHPALTGEKN